MLRVKMRTGIYARVSVRHFNDKDLTIENQILIAEGFIRENGMQCVQIYKDSGFSGLDFERPAFKKLMDDIKKHKLDAVVVKDFSRLGRNYIETSEYIEKIFPEYGVRFIAVSDGYDSIDGNRDAFMTGIKNIVNEWYARESGRKVSAAKQYQKSKGGYVGSVAPYGCHAIVKDGIRILEKSETMEVIEKIKELRDKGYTSAEIAEWLDCHRINRPSVYNATGEVYCTGTSFKKWDAGSVRRIWGTHTSGDNHTA